MLHIQRTIIHKAESVNLHDWLHHDEVIARLLDGRLSACFDYYEDITYHDI
jgi:hypothetical protein